MYDSTVVIYNHKAFIRLATDNDFFFVMNGTFEIQRVSGVKSFGSKFCGRSNKCSTMNFNDSRVVLTRKLINVRLYSHNI